MEAAAAIKDADKFAREFILKEVSDIRQAFKNEADLIARCKSFAGIMKAPTDKLAKLLKVILAVVRARTSASEPQQPAKKKAKTIKA